MPSDRHAQALAAFQYPDYRLYQAARMLTIVGTEMESIAVGMQLYSITGRPLDLGLAGLAQFLPGIFLNVVAGHTADRFDRRRVMLVCFIGYLICALLLLGISVVGWREVLPIYAVLVLLGVVRAFSAPASQALMPQMVPAEVFPNAVAWGSSVFQVSSILGPALGGIVYAVTGGPAAVYATASISYLCAITAIAMVKTRTGRMEHRDVSMETLLAGLRYVWEKKIVLGAVSLDLFAVLLGGAVALLPIYATDILKVGPTGFGMLRAAPAVGAATMAVVLAYRPLRRRAGAVMFWCVGLFGVATLVFGISKVFWVSLAALVIVGASDMVSVFVRHTLIQLQTPPEMRGRVSATNMLFISASNELGQFESGITAQWLGTVPAVVFGGIGTLVVVAVWTLLFPELRKVDRLVVTSEVRTEQTDEVAPSVGGQNSTG